MDLGEITIGTITRGEPKRGARWIKPNPYKSGPADAWVLPRHVSVWAVIRQLQLDSWQAELVAEGFELPLKAVEAAIRYYRRHKASVDARIERNRLFFGS
jgi:uncharacterized protein (DUF433 family)